MRQVGTAVSMLMMSVALGSSIAAAKTMDGRPLKQLPSDVMNLVLAWTEPIKAVVKDTRQFDPVGGLWFGLVDGSIKSVERTAAVFFPEGNDAAAPTLKGGKALLRYSF